MENLIDAIEGFLEANDMSASTFGSKALNDPPFVQQLRDGRDVKTSTDRKVRSFIAEYAPAQTERAA